MRKFDLKPVIWMIPGAIFMLLIMLIVFHFSAKNSPEQQMVSKSRRIDLVSRMQLALWSASEAEKSSVMALTDEESKKYADRARTLTEEVERQRVELDGLLRTGGTKTEQDLLFEFGRSFIEYRRIDNEVLNLAVQNSNLKAYSLTFGPAAKSVAEMNEAVSRFATSHERSPGGANIVRLVCDVQTNSLRILAMLAPHIAEESNEKMDELEALISEYDNHIRRALDRLAALSKGGPDRDLAHALSSYSEFEKTRREIVKLSRENTNVRSLTISLNQKRNITAACEESLSALKQAIADEPMRGVTNRRPMSPR